MRDKAPTIAEVARSAKVAASTVSRVLNGGYASPDVKARVEKVMNQLGYTPSPTARNLKMGRSGIIGLVVESTQGFWFTEILQGVEEELSDKRISVALCSLALTGEYDSSAVEAWITERRIDGIIFCRSSKTERLLVQKAQDAGLPVVFIAPDDTFRKGHAVRARNRDAGHDVAEHLVKLGHKRVAFAGGPRVSLDSRDRLQGLQDGLLENGIKLDEEHVTFGDSYRPESGMVYAEKWLAMPRSKAPTAVVTGNDAMALGFLRAVQSRGVKVPEDVSVVGFDGVPEGGLWWPGLTSALQPARQMGREACRAVLECIETKETPEGTALEMPMELVVRESTGPAPGSGGPSASGASGANNI
jgi:DNA-binding LacI/PurR family transcriptional regulator